MEDMTPRLTLRHHLRSWGRKAAAYEKVMLVCVDISLQISHSEGMSDVGHLGIVWQVRCSLLLAFSFT